LFLNLIDASVPDALKLHLICDNYAIQKTRRTERLLRSLRFHPYFTSTSASWIN
jgi:hypothetical protein